MNPALYFIAILIFFALVAHLFTSSGDGPYDL